MIDIIYNGFRIVLQLCIYRKIENRNETPPQRQNVGESSSANASHIQMQPVQVD